MEPVTESQSKNSRLLAITDPHACSVAKSEASSPSKGPGAIQQELQDIVDERLRMKMHDLARKGVQACMDEDESNQTPDGIAAFAAAPKWKEFMRP